MATCEGPLSVLFVRKNDEERAAPVKKGDGLPRLYKAETAHGPKPHRFFSQDLFAFLGVQAKKSDRSLVFEPISTDSSDAPFVIAPVIGALRFNRWFEELHLIGPQTCTLHQLAVMLSANRHLKVLRLPGFVVKESKDGLYELAQALAINQKSSLRELDLCYNPIRDRGLQTILTAFSATVDMLRLTSLSLAHCGLTAKSVRLLLASPVAQRLVCLDLSGNKLGRDGTAAIVTWMHYTNQVIETLNVADSGFHCENSDFTGLLAAGGRPSLTALDLSGLCTNGETAELAVALRRSQIDELKLNELTTTAAGLLNMLGGGKRMLGSHLTLLEMTDLKLPNEAIAAAIRLCTGMAQLKCLNVSRSFRSRGSGCIVQAVCDVLRANTLEELCIAGEEGRQLGAGIAAIAGASGKLVALDISGQNGGVLAIEPLITMIAQSTTLSSLSLDGNGFDVEGFLRVSAAVVGSKTIVEFPCTSPSPPQSPLPAHPARNVLTDDAAWHAVCCCSVLCARVLRSAT